MQQIPAALALALLLMCSPAWSQESLAGVHGDMARILSVMEQNLTEAEAIRMNHADWSTRMDGVEARASDLNSRFEQANAYCQGTFEHEEYVRRLAYCNALFAQLDEQKAQLGAEYESLKAEYERLQDRDTKRRSAYGQLEASLGAALPRLISFCASMPPAEQGSGCRLPPAPGPRTAEIVGEMNTTLNRTFGP